MSAAGVGRVGNLLPGQRRTEVVPRLVDYTEITIPQRGQELYNPDPDEDVIGEFNGERYTIPASTRNAVFRDPITLVERTYPKQGVCPVRDYTVTIHGKRYTYLSKDIIKFFCGEDGRSGILSPLGVRPLFGDNGEKDRAAMEDAKQAWSAGKDEEAFRLTRSHEEKVAYARDTGGIAPRPSPRILWAYNWVDARNAEVMLPFSCPVCNQGFKQERESLIHTISRHKKHPAAQDAARALDLTGPTGNVPEIDSGPAAPVSSRVYASPTSEAEALRILEARERAEQESAPESPSDSENVMEDVPLYAAAPGTLIPEVPKPPVPLPTPIEKKTGRR